MKKENRFIKFLNSKITRFTATSLLVGGALTGVGFGFANYNHKDISPSTDYKSKIETTVDIDKEYGATYDPYEVAKDLTSTLEWIGYIESEVDVLDRDTLLLRTDLHSTIDYNNLRSFEDLNDTLDELIVLYSTVFFNRNIEFRTIDSDVSLFTDNDGDGWYEYERPADEDEETKKLDTQSTYNKFEADLIESASVTLKDGNPAVELVPTKEYLNEIKKMQNSLFEISQASPGKGTYVVWFGHDVLAEIADKIDPGWEQGASGGSLYRWAYLNPDGTQSSKIKDIAKPFIISVESPQKFYSFEDSFKIGKELNQNTANQVAERINFSTKDYELQVISTTWNNPEKNIIDIQITFMIFATIILLIMFTFTWYFGLLGVINATLQAVVALGVMGIIVTLAIPVTIGVLTALSMIIAISGIISWNTLSLQKEIYLQKETIWNSYKMINLRTMRRNSYIFIVLTLLTFGIAMFVAPITSIGIWMMFIALIMSYVAITFVIPALSLLTMLFNGRQQIRKWNYILGRKHIEFNYSIAGYSGKESTKTMKYGMITMLSISLIGFMTLGIISAVGHTGLNVNKDYDRFYKYEISLIDRYDFSYSGKAISPDDPQYDPMEQEEYISEVKKYSKDIVNEIKTQAPQVHIIDTEITKNEQNIAFSYLIPDGVFIDEYKYSFSYGLVITTENQLTSDQINAIDAEVSTYQAYVNDAQKTGFEFMKSLSAATMDVDENTGDFSGKSAELFNDTTKIRLINYVFGIVTGFSLAAFFILIFLGWTGFVSIIGMSVLEMIGMFATFPLLWLPFGFTFFSGMTVVAVMSIVSKTQIVSEAKTKIRRGIGPEEAVKTSLSENRNKWLIFNGVMALFTIVLTGVFGMVMLPALLAVITGMAMIEILNTFVTPRVMVIAEVFHQEKKEELHSRALLRQKFSDVVEEEYVEGVNC